MEMTTNLHTHTFRCNHASGTEREYIENALAAGLKTLGFADHAPYAFPAGGYYSGFRMKRELQEDYVNTLLALREEYRGRIEIKIGYECEYYPEFFTDTVKLLTRYPVDYMILGQHFIENELTGKYAGITTDDEGFLAAYVEQVCEGMKTGLFTYFAHPDLVNYTGANEVFDKHYSRLIECAKSEKIPLEINLLGIRDNRTYPHKRFFRLCEDADAEVCIGCDAHSPDVAYDAPSYKKATEMVREFGLRLVKEPVLRPLTVIE